MTHRIFYVIICSFILGCNKPKEKLLPKTKSTIINSTVPVKDSNKLFLSLDTNMSDKEFSKAIDSLKKNRKLIDGKFVLKIWNQDIPFSISKSKEAIILKYETIKDSPIVSNDERDFSFFLNNYHRTAEDLIKIFDEKYEKFIYALPKKQVLSSYGFNEYHRKLYVTPHKVILIEYSIIGRDLEIPSAKGRKQIGCRINIYYYHNIDFKKILNSLDKQKRIESNRETEAYEIRVHEENLKKENTHNI